MLMAFREHIAFVPPAPDEQKMWRYMDFTKFVSMLATRALYFSSLKKLSELDDQFEGMLPDKYYEYRTWQTIEDVPEHERLRFRRLNVRTDVPLARQLEIFKGHRESVVKQFVHLRKTLYVNCWHMNNDDSSAMWSIYASRGSGIAITSSYDLLRASIHTDKALYGGKIEYIDYSKSAPDEDLIGNILAAPTRKRMSFNFEREFRIVFWDETHVNSNTLADIVLPDGCEFRCDLSTLIDEIYVSPKSASWFLELVQSVVQTYGLNKTVKRSALDSSPIDLVADERLIDRLTLGSHRPGQPTSS
jgi:hypothetical protein